MKFVVLILLIAVVGFFMLKKKAKQVPTEEEPPEAKKGTYTKRPIATENEQGMYWRLMECFQPVKGVVLAQVSFGALLKAKDGASRYSFSQKMADFVLLNKSFDVVAVIELDDSSHKGKEASDEARDAMLRSAGYNVLRYKTIPDTLTLLSDVKKLGVAF